MKKVPAKTTFSFGSIYFLLSLLLVASMLIGMRVGAVNISFGHIFSYILDATGINPRKSIDAIEKGLFLQIRLPRVLLCMAVGAALGVSGALMQALFRNPIVEPGLVGTSAGAALGAAAVFVLGAQFKWVMNTFISSFILPLCAFGGGLAATLIVYKLATVRGKITIAAMILIGVAINALATGGTGFLSLIARDPQARSITFWDLGTFSGADWNSFCIVLASTTFSILAALHYAKGLNALLLGEPEAQALGVNTEKLKTRIILINTFMVAIATSFVGVISFVGLVVPHILRMLKSADNRYLIIGSALLGGSLMVLADAVARTIIAPGEMPIGILTALVGAPVFISMLIHQSKANPGGGFYA